MAAAGTSGFARMEERGYFLLLDRLQCTLEDKIDVWRDYDDELAAETGSEVGQKRREFLAERLHVAVDEMIRAVNRVDRQQQQQAPTIGQQQQQQWHQKGQRRFRKR